MPRVDSIDTLGTQLGQAAANPDSTVVFVPRTASNDVAQIDLTTQMLFPAFLTGGGSPTDVVAISHEAGLTLRATSASASSPCHASVPFELRTFDACGLEIFGVPVQARAGTPNISVTPAGSLPTPATFQVMCLQGGQASINFTTTAFPFITISESIECRCRQHRCLDFSTFASGPLIQPGNLAGIISVETVQQVFPNGPAVAGPILRMFQGSVRFTVVPGYTIDDLTIRMRRHDPFPPQETVVVTHSGGISTVNGPGLSRGTFDIVCPFTGITEWTVLGGIESDLLEICVSI